MSHLSSLEYYDKILHDAYTATTSSSEGNNNNNTTSISVQRKGNLVAIPIQDGPHDEIAICNIAAMIPASFADAGFYLQDIYGLAALQISLAVEHLNTGNGSIVQNLHGLDQRCPIRFTLEMIDTGLAENIAVNEVINVTDRHQHGNGPPVCAFHGASRSAVSMATATITGLRGYPQISAASTSPILSNENSQQLYPLFGRTIPADDGIAIPIIQHYMSIDVEYLGVLYVNDPYGTAFARGLHEAAATFAPNLSIKSVEIAPIDSNTESIERAVRELKATEYQYIFAIINVDGLVEKVMLEAFDQGIAGTGHHTWMFSDASMGDIILKTAETDSPIHKALTGTGIIMASGGQADYNPVLKNYRDSLDPLLNPTDLDLIVRKSPYPNLFNVDEMLNGIRFGPSDPYGAFIYDSIIAIGLGACNAASEAEAYAGDIPAGREYFDGYQHFDSITRTTFVGPSGAVQLNPQTGSREPSSTYYGLNRIVFTERNSTSVQAHIELSSLFDQGVWRELEPFVYADGSTTPLDAIPDPALDPNYLGIGWRISGWVMCGLGLALAVVFATWTKIRSKNRVVTASQPFFLYLICFGIAIFVSSIIPLGFDEEIANADGCTIACNAFIWLISIGFSVTFSALFTKTHRVNMIFKNPGFKRIKVTPMDVAKPMIICLGANILVLILMAVIAPLEWTVQVLDEDQFDQPIETQGFCNWSNSIPFLIPLAVINLCCLLYALVQAYEARGISIEFAESEYIFRCMIVITLACFLSFPVLVLIQENKDAFYFFLSATIFITGSLVLLLIFVPKIMFLRHKNKHPESRVRVSMSVPASSFLEKKSSLTEEEEGLLILSHPKTEAKLRERVAELEHRLHMIKERCNCSLLSHELSSGMQQGGADDDELSIPLNVPQEEASNETVPINDMPEQVSNTDNASSLTPERINKVSIGDNMASTETIES